MTATTLRYEFGSSLSMDDVEASLVLALVAVESLHGETTVLLEPCHALDAAARVCAIACDTPIGHDLNHLFAGFLRREFGPESFSVRRIPESTNSAAA